MGRLAINALGFIALLVAAAPPLRGQTTSGLLITPWFGDHVQSSTDTFLFPAAHLSNTGSSIQLSEVQSEGRWRFAEDEKPGSALGYSLRFLSLREQQGLVPGQLTDISIGGSLPLGTIGDWQIALAAAPGYAGDRPFSTGTAWYGRATLLIERDFTPDQRLQLLLEYDGNRGVLPDVPMPGIEFRSKVSDRLTYILGYPTTAIIFKPLTQLEVNVNWYVPQSFDASLEYTPIPRWSVIGSFSANDVAFHASALPGNRRIFYLESRFELGIRWTPDDSMNFAAAVGYAIDRRFYQGFDEINLHHVASLADEPYLRINMTFGF